jgi:hypothetical protein
LAAISSCVGKCSFPFGAGGALSVRVLAGGLGDFVSDAFSFGLSVVCLPGVFFCGIPPPQKKSARHPPVEDEWTPLSLANFPVKPSAELFAERRIDIASATVDVANA